MALSEQEQRVLDEIENALYQEDPHFGEGVDANKGSNFSVRVVALLVLGLAILVGGIALCQVSLWFVALSVLGFLVMFAAGYWALRGDSGQEAGSFKKPGSKKSRNGRSGKKRSFGGGASSMEENFRRRFER